MLRVIVSGYEFGFCANCSTVSYYYLLYMMGAHVWSAVVPLIVCFWARKHSEMACLLCKFHSRIHNPWLVSYDALKSLKLIIS